MTISIDYESSLRQMQAGVDAISEGFALFSDNDELVYCNAAFKKLYPDLVNYLKPGLSWSVFLVEANRKRNSAGLAQLDNHLSSGINSPLTLEGINLNGRWYRLGLQWINEGGFLLNQIDVTDQHQAHEVIEHADDLLRNILDACASRIVLCRLSDGLILYRTPAWGDTFGPVDNIRRIFHEPIAYADLLADVLATSRLDDQDNTMLHASGESFPTRTSARVIDYQGEPAVVLSMEDMTQLYHQRNEIIQTNQRLLDAIEALDQGFVLFDADHQLIMANQHYLNVNKPIANYLQSGATNSELVERSKLENHEPLAAGWPESQDEPVTAKYEFELQDQRAFAVSRRATSDGGFVIAWRDVTEQRATEQELSSRREAAFQNEKLSALGQLLAGVAHELNNPLSVVLGHSMMLKEEVTDPDTLDGIEKISRSAERCAKIVKTFLAMARQKPAQLELGNMNDIIDMSLEIASYSIRKSGIQIDLRLADELPVLSIDEDQVTQVFINLMINAEQALRTNTTTPTLRISTTYNERSKQVIARVSDNGPGVSIANKLRIFEPFYTTKEIGEGTGVGLALSHRIISSHGGNLTVSDSELGGATFEVRLPIAPLDTVRVPTITVQNDSRTISALLIEDEPDVADMMQKLLSSMDVDVTTASSAEDAIKILAADNTFNVILCDLRMPGIGGMGLYREIESQWPALLDRFVFVTGDAISDDVKHIRNAAHYKLLEKPVSPAELNSLLQSLKSSMDRTSNAEKDL